MNILPAAIRLIPPRPAQGLHIILFVAHEDPYAEQTWLRATALDWPAGTLLYALVADEAPEITSWFGIARFPALAALMDGSLVALEDGCEQGCAERLLTHARHAVTRLDEL
jgi:hypothetical protein